MLKSIIFTISLIIVFFISSGISQNHITGNSPYMATYFGGNSVELFLYELDEFGFLQHPNGSIYICGSTQSNNINTLPGAFREYHSGGESESFVARFDPTLSHLEACTYLGGSEHDIATDLFLDQYENIVIVGHTTSPDFPVSENAYDTTYTPATWDQFDAFITILSPELDDMIASTYLGGSNPDWFNLTRGTMDNNGNIVIAGGTISGDFPVTPDAYQTSGGVNTGPDAYISKLSSDLSTLISSTYFGKFGMEHVNDIMVDKENNIIICGTTGSPYFPTTPGAYSTFNGDGDTYISKFTNNLDTLIASTCLGGSELDFGLSMDFDSIGNIYVCGETESYDFPFTGGAFDTSFNFGYYDCFVSLLDKDLENLIASSFLGSSDWDFSRDLVYDYSTQSVFITGLAGSADFPVTANAFDTVFHGASEIFVSRMTANLNKIISSTFVGGEDEDFGLEVIVSADDNVYFAGNTYSYDFPTTPGAYNEISNGSIEVFIAQIDKDLSGQFVDIETPITNNTESIIMYPVFPNPSKGIITITFQLDEGSNISFDAYNIHGTKVATIGNRRYPPGLHHVKWDIQEHAGHQLPQGIYSIILRTDSAIVSQKAILN